MGPAVAASRAPAIAAGEAVLSAGGNAVDAAVAVSLAIGAVEPHMSGLGGVLELVYRAPSGEVHVVDGAAHAPAAASPDTFRVAGGPAGLYGWPAVEGARNVHGPASVAPPRLAAALAAAHRRFGVRPWAEAVAPAVAVADGPLDVDFALSSVLVESMETLAHDRLAAAVLYPGGRPLPPPVDGPPVQVRNPALARALGAIAADGAAGWAPGGAAAGAVLDALGPDGLLAPEDFGRPVEILDATAPLTTFRGWAVHGSPRASGAVSAAHVLGILDRLPLPATAHARLALVARAAVVAFRVRLQQLRGDDPSAAVLTPERLDRDAAAARTLRFTAAAGTAPPPTATTTFSVADGDGGVVAATQTLLGLFGSHVGVPELGCFLNDGMMWFDPRPGRPASIAPGARALSAVSPLVLVSPDGSRCLAVGAAGARRIVTAVAQIAQAVIDDGLGADAAVQRPRVHADSLAPVAVDHRLGPEAVAALRADGLDAEAVHFGPTTLTSGLGCAVLTGAGRPTETGVDRRSEATWRFGMPSASQP